MKFESLIVSKLFLLLFHLVIAKMELIMDEKIESCTSTGIAIDLSGL